MGFSENLKTLRLAKSMTQKQLAQKLGVRRQSIVDWENPDGNRPDFLNLVGLVTVLEVSWNKMMDGEVQKIKETNPEWKQSTGLITGLRLFAKAIDALNAEVFHKQQKGENK